MMRSLGILLALLALTAAAVAQMPMRGVGPGDEGGVLVACNADGLDFTDGCGTTQLMVFM